MTQFEKYVRDNFPSARCIVLDRNDRPISLSGKKPYWFVIFINYDTQIYDLGVSRKSELLAWKRAAFQARKRLEQQFLKRLES